MKTESEDPFIRICLKSAFCKLRSAMQSSNKKNIIPVNSASLWLTLVFLALFSCRHDRKPDWTSLKQEIRAKFPMVSQISTEQLAEWLESNDKEKPLLLDVREEREYLVSHLQGALLASTEGEALKILKMYPKEHPVVLYCSVGYRSSRMAERLEARGYNRVYNLEGSIFQWANEGGPLYAKGERVKRVHPYNDYWGQLLEKKLWADSLTKN